MKKLSLFLVPSLALGLAACQSDDALNSASNDSAQNATITVSIPDAMTTRAADELTTATDALFGPTSNSAMGGLTNLMNPKETATNVYNKYDLRYKLAVYEATKIVEKDTTWTLVIPANADNNTLRTLGTWTGGADANKQTFSLQLLPTHTYKVVCWADFVKKGETGDLHYATDCLSNANATSKVITRKDAATAQLNDESRDAYYIQQTFKEVTTGLNANLVLRRPFAKIRFVTTDWQSMDNAKDEWPDTYKLTYHGCKRFNTLNPVTGVSEGVDLPETGNTTYEGNKISLTSREYALNYDMHKKNRTLVVDYLMTEKPTENSTGETAIHMNFEAINSTSGQTIMTRDFTTDIPIKRNWLTTILGNLLTVNGTFTVSINENFYNEWVDAEPWDGRTITAEEPKLGADGKYHITKPEEFAWLAYNKNVKTTNSITGGEDRVKAYFQKGVVLDADIDMDNIDWSPIVMSENDLGTASTCVFDGNNHVLRNFKINFRGNYAYNGVGGRDVGVFGCFTGTIKNVTFENITINGLYGSNGHNASEDYNGKETAFYAGPIGRLCGNLENVHSKHVFIRGYIDEKEEPSSSFWGSSYGNIMWGNNPLAVGGLVGEMIYRNDWSKASPNENRFTITKCSSEDVHIVGQEAGGLVGRAWWGYVFDDCQTNYVHIQMMRPYWVGRFIGSVAGYTWIRANCEASPDANTFFVDAEGNTYKDAEGKEFIEDDTSKHLYGHLLKKGTFMFTFPGFMSYTMAQSFEDVTADMIKTADE